MPARRRFVSRRRTRNSRHTGEYAVARSGYNRVPRALQLRYSEVQTGQFNVPTSTFVANNTFTISNLITDLSTSRQFQITGFQLHFNPVPTLTVPIEVQLQYAAPVILSTSPVYANVSAPVALSPSNSAQIEWKVPMHWQQITTSGSLQPVLNIRVTNPSLVATLYTFTIRTWVRLTPDSATTSL